MPPKKNSKADNMDEKAPKSSSKMYIIMLIFIALVPVLKTYFADDPLIFMYPNLLMFTPFRNTTINYWKEHLHIDKSVVHEPTHIPVIDAKDYSMEALRVATENWRYPAVVRGMFLGSPAVDKWPEPGYLSGKIGDWEIPVVNNAIYGTMQNDRSVMKFRDAYEEVLRNDSSKLYMFFPVKSRFSFNHSELGKLNALQDEINKVVMEDLELDRIWPGFGKHSVYHGAQLIAGRGTNSSDYTTGTGWHCAIGNNWFAQVAGTKRWYFMDPKYSSAMSPGRGGKVNMMTTNRNMADFQKHIPLRYGDIKTGDLLYNPDWEWHTIKNFEGLSIGVPMREVNISLALRNNLQYTSIVLLNTIFDKIGIDIGGYPPNK